MAPGRDRKNRTTSSAHHHHHHPGTLHVRTSLLEVDVNGVPLPVPASPGTSSDSEDGGAHGHLRGWEGAAAAAAPTLDDAPPSARTRLRTRQRLRAAAEQPAAQSSPGLGGSDGSTGAAAAWAHAAGHHHSHHHRGRRGESESISAAEWRNMALLVLLYAMQGIPLGLTLGAM